jgi:phage terminase large subunit
MPLLKDQTRTQILFGGSSSGKSVFLAQRCVLDVATQNRNYLCTRKTGNTIRRSTFNEICKAITKFKMGPVFPSINKTEMVITCANGYQILFAGLDDVEKLKSITPQKGPITDIWVEEATETDEDDIKQLDKRLRGLTEGGDAVNKRLILSFNPILKSHWIFQRYFGNWVDGENEYKTDDIVILKTTYKDNRFLAPDDIKALENETDQYYRDVYVLGNWGTLGDVIFKNWEVADLSKMRNQFINRKHGLDFGFSSDPAAMPCTHYDRAHKTIYIYDELYERELTNDMLAKRVKDKVGQDYITGDSAEPKSIAELRGLGVNIKGARKGKDSVNHGIQWLQQQRIVVDVHCVNMKNELQQYQWKQDKDGNSLAVPIDKHNHLMDGLRYAYEDEYKPHSGPVRVRGL